MSGKIFKNIVITLACILIAVLLAIFLFGYIKGYSVRYVYKKLVPGSVEGIYKAVEIYDTENYEWYGSVETDGSYIYMLGLEDAVSVDTTNGDITYISFDYSNPVMTSFNDIVMVYDKSTGTYSILKDGTAVEKSNIEEDCLGANILSDGNIGFIMPGGDGFLGSFILVNSEYKKMAEYYYSDRYPVSGCVSSDGDYLAIAGIQEKNAGKTSIDIYGFGEESPVSGKNLDYIAPMLAAFGKDSFAACGTDSIDIYSFRKNTLINLEIDNVLLVEGCYKGLMVAASGTGTDSLMLVSEEGNVVWKKNIPAGTQGIEVSGEHIFYWNMSESGVMDIDGNSYEIQGDVGVVRAVVGLGQYKMAVVTDTNIILYEFN